MMIPNFSHAQLVNKDGYLTPEWEQILSQLFQALQSNFNTQGCQMPKQTADIIAQLTDSSKQGAIMYDTDNHLLKANINGVIKTITVA